MEMFSGWLLRAWYSPRPVWFFIPFAWLFWLLSSLRRAAYTLRLIHSASVPAAVIIVGNISVGGTGKTPFVIWLAGELTRMGYKAGIVSRGYGGQTQSGPALVTPDSDPEVAGDEAVLLAKRTGLPVAICRDRAAAANLLCSRYTMDVLLSDDGLQHHHLSRDMEIVLLDGERGLGNGWLLPAGPLRETEQRLNEVGLTVIKRAVAPRFTWPGAAYMQLVVATAVSLNDGRRVPLTQFAGQSAHALAGIGNPQQFFDALKAAGLQVDGRALVDHARLTPGDMQFPDDRPVFMTEKDAVKCRSMALSRHWYVEAAADFSAADRALILERVERAIKARRPHNH
jgi:tetraacyldisaccharide 4'-kinase